VLAVVPLLFKSRFVARSVASGLRIAKLIKGSRLVVVKDGPHCITWTHPDEVNSELVNFLGKGLAKHATAAPKKEAVA